jgi:lysophospholipase L1-like esterase
MGRMSCSTRAQAVTAALIFVSACSQSPTAPTPTAPGVTVGETAQTPPPVPAAITPSPQALGATRFMAFGDSITCGVVSVSSFSLLPLDCGSTEYGYPERLTTMLRTYNTSQAFSVRKRGQPGEWAQQGISRLMSELSELAGPSVPVASRPQVLLLLEGVNDMNGGGLSAARAAGSIAEMVQIARLYNMTVLVATMYQTYRNEATGHDNARDKIVEFNGEVRRLVGGQQNVRIVDLYASFGTTAYGTLVGFDGLHPTPAGYERMAQQFHAAVLQQFPVRGGLQ